VSAISVEMTSHIHNADIHRNWLITSDIFALIIVNKGFIMSHVFWDITPYNQLLVVCLALVSSTSYFSPLTVKASSSSKIFFFVFKGQHRCENLKCHKKLYNFQTLPQAVDIGCANK
jgi:hypothetical protein